MNLLPNEYVISLATLNRGAALELFDDALRKVIENIHDPNADIQAKREIKLTVKFAPSVDRNGKAQADVDIACALKLGAARPSTTIVYFGKVDGEIKGLHTGGKVRRINKERP